MGISNPSLNNGPVKLRLPSERDGDKRPEPGSPEYGIPSSLSSVFLLWVRSGFRYDLLRIKVTTVV